MGKYIGKKIDGRYEILELIGVGGMANVYRARDVVENRMVAVKILREEFLENEEFLRRFGVSSVGELPQATPEQLEGFKEAAEEEAGTTV